jgi:glucokinase
VASGWGIAKLARAWAETGICPDSELFKLVCGRTDLITAVHVGKAAAMGDPFARLIVHVACEHLAAGIAEMIALLCPRRIVVGGGVALMGEGILFEPLRKQLAEHVFKPFAGCYDIVPAALGEEVVVHGALALARRQFTGSD